MATIDLNTWDPNPLFAGLADLAPTPNQAPSTTWQDNQLGLIPKWEVPEIPAANFTATATGYLSAIMNNNISVQTAVNGLKLAFSLKSMNPSRAEPLLRAQARPEEATPALARAVNMPEIGQFPGTRIETTLAPAIAIAQAPRPGQPIPIMNQAGGGVEQPAVQVVAYNMGDDSEVQKQQSASFIALWLMRLLTKSPENSYNALPNMKSRFTTFYYATHSVNNFHPTLQALYNYKIALQNQAELGITLSHAVAFTHSTKEREYNSREFGVLSYASFLPLSYTGMHAYTLIMDLYNESKCPLNKLLSLFEADTTHSALVGVHDILVTHERTVAHPERSPIFRYCTLWDAKYFSVVRTKNCRHLVYTAACAYNALVSGGQNADPEGILGVRSLSDSFKVTLKRAGVIIGNTLKQSMLGGANKSPVWQMAITDEGPRPIVQENMEWDNL